VTDSQHVVRQNRGVVTLLLLLTIAAQVQCGSTNGPAGPSTGPGPNPRPNPTASPNPSPSAAPNTGTISFWTSCSNCSGLRVTFDNAAIGTLNSYFNGTPNCGQSGTLTVSKASGTYSYAARDDSGRTWTGSANVTGGSCRLFELRGSTNTPPPPTASCNWNSAPQCVQVVSATRGTRCGSPTSLEVKVRNACTSPVKFVVSIQRSDGTWDALPDGTFSTGTRPGEVNEWFECNTANRYRVYSMPINDFVANRCKYPEQ
jgi:hypothetical protein